MGKGDKKTRRGKIVNQSYGVRRRKTKKRQHLKPSADNIIDNKNIKSLASVTSEVSEKTSAKPAGQRTKKEEPATVAPKKENTPTAKTEKKPVEAKTKEKSDEKPTAKKGPVDKEDE